MSYIVKDGIKIRESNNNKIIIEPSIIDKNVQYALENDLMHFELNYAFGFREKDISFLDEIADYVQGITIVMSGEFDIDIIHKCKNLEYLAVSFLSNVKFPIEFDNFPKLKECYFKWRKGSESLFECKNLKLLSIGGYDKSDLKCFETINTIEYLNFWTSRTESLKGLEVFENLKKVELFKLRNLDSVQPLSFCSNIEEISISQCGKLTDVYTLNKIKRLNKLQLQRLNSFNNLDNFENFENLSYLKIEDCKIDSLKPIKNLHLKECYIYNSPINDKDINSLIGKEKFGITPNRGYSPSVQEVQEINKNYYNA